MTVISLTLLRRVVRRCRQTSSTGALLPSSSFIHVNDKRHHDVDEDCDRATRRPVEEDLAGRSPISFHKGRSHPCLAEQFFATTYPTSLRLCIFDTDLVIVHAPRRLYSQAILKMFLKLLRDKFSSRYAKRASISFCIKRHH